MTRKTTLQDIEITLNRLNADIQRLTEERLTFYAFQKKYLDSDGMNCPVCNASGQHLQYRALNVSKSVVDIEYTCNVCGSEWRGGFTPTCLVSIEPRRKEEE